MNGKVRLASPVASVRVRGFVGTDRPAVSIDPLENHLVFAHMQSLTSATTDRLHSDFG